MKKDFKAKVYTVFLGAARKHNLLKKPMLLCMTVVLACYYVVCHFVNNQKKYASICLVSLFFLMSSSFAFPETISSAGFVAADGEQTGTVNAAEENQNALNELIQENGTVHAQESQAMLAQQPEINENPKLPDDSDGVEEFEDADLHGTESGDQYTIDDIMEEEGTFQNQSADKEQKPEEEQFSFDSEDWRYVLINKQHPIPANYTFDLVTIKGNMQCDERIKNDLLSMLQSAKEDEVSLVIRSPYRDMSRQEFLFEKKIGIYMQNGMSYMEAYKTASQAVTVPGASEHQIGLAIDITCEGYAVLDEGFGETEAGMWLEDHACEFGFILRYPKGKEYITSIEYEPWHFRYVGKDAATVIMKNGLSLEEFVEDYL